MRHLTQRQRDEIDAALVDIYRACWEAGVEPDPPSLRAAYLQGAVDAQRSLRRTLLEGFEQADDVQNLTKGN